MASSPLPPPSPLDARRARFREMVIARLPLGGWVFRRLEVIPLVGLMVCLGAAAGQRYNPILRLWDAVIAPRLREPVTALDQEEPARFVELFEAAMLATATVLMAVDLHALAWLVALLVAFSAVTWATTGISVPNRIYWRLHGGRPSPPPRRSRPR